METSSRKYYAPDGKEFNLDDLEERLRSVRIDDYYLDERVYEQDASMRAKVEKGYLLFSSDDGREYGISGKLLQYEGIAQVVAAGNGLSPNQINRLAKGKLTSYLTGLSHSDATVLLSGMGLRMPSLEEFLELIKGSVNGELRWLNGETLGHDKLNAVHNPVPQSPDGWIAEYLKDKIVYAGGQWNVRSAHREAGGRRTLSTPLNGIIERYQETFEEAGVRLTVFAPPVEVPEDGPSQSWGYLSDGNLEPKVPLFLANNNPEEGITAILDCRINPDVIPTAMDVGVRPVLDRPMQYE